MKRRIVISFTAGLLATSGCGRKEPVPGNPPPVIENTPQTVAAGEEPEAPAAPETPSSTETLEGDTVPLSAPDPATDPRIMRNPPSPGTGTGPDGRPLIPVSTPDIMPSRPKPLPTWDDSKSPHPEGATNPPAPVLIVGAVDGACFKRWVSPFVRSAEAMTPHVETCTASPDSPHGNTCGAPIQCPPEAAQILSAYKASTGAP